MKPRKLSSGNYFIQVQVNGVRRSFCAPSRAEVIRKATEYKLTAVDAPSAPLGTLIDRYIDVKRNVLSPATITRYEQTRRLEFQRLMDVPVRELSADRLQAEINIMAADHSPKTVRNAYGLITAAMSMFAPELHFRVTLPKKKRITYNIPTDEQVYDMLSHASENLTTAIMLAAFCSMRRSEICALRSEDIEGNIIHVKRAYVHNKNGETVDKITKNYDSDRYVTAPDMLINHIKGKEGRVCPIALSTVTKEFGRISKKAGVKCRFHDLRHYYASALHAIGVPDQYIQKSGGWKTDTILKKVYRNTLSDFEKANAKKAAKYFAENIS